MSPNLGPQFMIWAPIGVPIYDLGPDLYLGPQFGPQFIYRAPIWDPALLAPIGLYGVHMVAIASYRATRIVSRVLKPAGRAGVQLQFDVVKKLGIEQDPGGTIGEGQ